MMIELFELIVTAILTLGFVSLFLLLFIEYRNKEFNINDLENLIYNNGKNGVLKINKDIELSIEYNFNINIVTVFFEYKGVVLESNTFKTPPFRNDSTLHFTNPWTGEMKSTLKNLI